MWNSGDRLSHRFNADLGPGLVIAVEGRVVKVLFPESGEARTFAVGSDALAPLALVAGGRARIAASGEVVRVAELDEDGGARLTDGRELPAEELWPLPDEPSPIDALARGKIGSPKDFANRLDALRFERLRQADGLGSFLGGRIQLFPHQLYAAERACANDPVRWLLADQVGLGKTVEACLIMNRLIHTGRAESTLVVAPETLTVQWLGELWRKYHQVFVLLDDQRLRDVVREHGRGFNPFDVYRRTIVSLERLRESRRLTEQAVEAGIDLLVVDEAHHLKRPPGHPGNPAWRAVSPIAAAGGNVLLLTATPLEDDAHGFFRLLQLLRPEELPEDVAVADRLEKRMPLPPCTSASRRTDIGGLPPRVPVAVELSGDDDLAGWEALHRLEEALRRQPAKTPTARRRKADLVFRALASPTALLPRLTRDGDEATRALAEAARDADPRLGWLAEKAGEWRRQREKSLVFVAHRETLELLKAEVESRGRVRVGIFHEDLTPERRDLEVAQFRLADGPALLISTECGGEGRNFEFCHRLVLYDLPWNPAVVEQRVGRLDRIGRSLPTEVVFFRPPGGFGHAVARLYEGIGLFREPLGGLERELRHVAREVERQAVEGEGEVAPEVFAAVLEEARQAHGRVREAAFHELHREPYRGEMAAEILARVPPDLDELCARVVRTAAARFGFIVQEQRAGAWRIEHGAGSLLERLPGVEPGARFLGTFDRETAVESEIQDYFASGHPLVEGILAELAESRRGRTALLQIPGDEEVFGLLAIYPLTGGDFTAVAVDAKGRRRDDLAARLTAPELERERVDAAKWTGQATWERGIRRLAAALPEDQAPAAVAAFRIRRAG